MVAIGELAYKCKFDARELVRGMMSTRAQMNAAKKLFEESRTPIDRYSQGLTNLAQMSQKYSAVAAKQIDIERQLEKQYLQEESAIRRLTKAEKARLELLNLPDQIKARAAANTPAMQRAARDAANKRAGLGRQAFLQGIDDQQAAGRSALADRLAAFKKEKAATAKAEDAFQSRIAKDNQAQAKARPAPGGSSMSMAVLPRYIGAAAALGYAKNSVLKFAEVEKSAAAFEVLSGSMQQSKKLMTDLRELAKTGLSFGSLAASAQTMMSFGLATDKVVPTLRALGEISRGDSERLKSLALAFGQTTAAGRLMGQEVLQMINAGFNPLQEISRTTGKSMVQLKKEMEEGGISATMVANSLISATSAGGRFEGMLAKINQTGAGSLTTIQNKFEAISLAVGESLIPLVKQLAGAMEDLTNSSTGKANSASDVLSNGFAGSIALVRSILRNDWKPVSEVLDSMDAKDREALAATSAAMAPAVKGTKNERERAESVSRLLDYYKQKALFKSPADFEIAVSKQKERIRWYDKEIEKEKELVKQKERRAQLVKAETDRANAARSLLKPMEDSVRLEQFNATSKLKAQSIEEIDIIKKMNAAERERLALLQSQTKEKEKAKKSREPTKFDAFKTRAEDLMSKVQSPTEQFRSQLKDIMVMSGMGMIDNITRNRAASAAYDSTIGAKRPELQLAPDLQMGTQGAYQALVSIQNSALDRQIKAQEKIAEIQKEANRLLGEVRTAINEMKDELKEALPGDGG